MGIADNEIIQELSTLFITANFSNPSATALELVRYYNNDLPLEQTNPAHWVRYHQIAAKIKSLTNNIFKHTNHKIHITYIEHAYHLVFVYEYEYRNHGASYDYYDNGCALENGISTWNNDLLYVGHNIISLHSSY
jgi:hypothetical protein